MSSHKTVSETENTTGVAELAHDLNNLLVGIIGNAQLLEEDVGKEQLPLVRQILSCAGRATSITENLLQEDLTGDIERPPHEENPVDTETLPASNSVSRKRDTVLVIDDEDVVRSIGAAVLARSGYRALVASNGPEGIRLFESNKERVVCVFLDLTMPYMRGNLVFARLKAIDPTVHVYLMSGYSDQQALYEFDAQEILGFIQKPFQNEDILLAVERSESMLNNVIPIHTGNR